MPAAASEHEPRHSGCLGSKLQPARGGQAQFSADFAHHGGQSGMAQPFLHGEQHCIRLASFGIHHAMGRQTHAGESGSEQVGSHQHPQHVAPHPGEPAGNEQRRRGAVLCLRPGAGNLMQRATRQATTGKMSVNRRYVERCHRPLPPRRSLLQPRDASAKRCELLVLDAG